VVPRHSRKSGVRDRLLDAADRLFYKEGIRAIGIDRVLAEADAAKASLYSHFGCKDELVAAYVERRVVAARERIEAYVAGVPPSERALRFFDWVVTWVESPDFRGCPLQHVVSELSDLRHPARRLAAAQRKWLLARFNQWARAARAADPAATAGAFMVLFDGAIAASEQDGPQRARDARRIAERLLAPKPTSRSPLVTL
jgi:AcrR family transcriptional regulator